MTQTDSATQLCVIKQIQVHRFCFQRSKAFDRAVYLRPQKSSPFSNQVAWAAGVPSFSVPWNSSNPRKFFASLASVASFCWYRPALWAGGKSPLSGYSGTKLFQALLGRTGLLGSSLKARPGPVLNSGDIKKNERQSTLFVTIEMLKNSVTCHWGESLQSRKKVRLVWIVIRFQHKVRSPQLAKISMPQRGNKWPIKWNMLKNTALNINILISFAIRP